MVRYLITSGRVTVTARSMVHDTKTIWDQVSGTIEVDPANPAAGATATIEVDMRAFDAGDRLKNWKLKSDLDPDRHPTARFTLSGLTVGTQSGARVDGATARGQLAWRGKATDVTASGTGTLEAATLAAEARFELDVRTLGVEPPKILMIKVDPTVSVVVTLSARAS